MPETERSFSHDSEEDPRNADILIWVDGKLLPRDKASVSVYDSGFMLGDGVWEGLRLFDGHIAFLDEHLDRLYEAARFIELDIGQSRSALKAALSETLRANGMHTDAHVRLMVTRGRKRKPFQHPHLSMFGATVVIIAEHSRPVSGVGHPGIRLGTVPHHRGLPLTQDAKLNSHSKLNCIIALNHAVRAGADEALMLDPFGFVNTTNACNFFVVRRGEVWTSTGAYCMNGITRRKVIELCKGNGIPVLERDFSLLEAYGAEEAFLTGTFGAQTLVTEIDGHLIGDGSDYPLFLRIRELYEDLINSEVARGRGKV